jgi:hypothetical protein
VQRQCTACGLEVNLLSRFLSQLDVNMTRISCSNISSACSGSYAYLPFSGRNRWGVLSIDFTLFNLRVLAGDMEHKIPIISLRLNSVKEMIGSSNSKNVTQLDRQTDSQNLI